MEDSVSKNTCHTNVRLQVRIPKTKVNTSNPSIPTERWEAEIPWKLMARWPNKIEKQEILSQTRWKLKTNTWLYGMTSTRYTHTHTHTKTTQIHTHTHPTNAHLKQSFHFLIHTCIVQMLLGKWCGHGHDWILSFLSPGLMKIISCIDLGNTGALSVSPVMTQLKEKAEHFLSPVWCCEGPFPTQVLIFFSEEENNLSSVFLSDTGPWGIVSGCLGW